MAQKTIPRTCQVCGNTFHVRPVDVKIRPCRCCSPQCSTELRRQQSKSMEKACLNCGKKTTLFPSRVKRTGGKFCSNACHYTHQMNETRAASEQRFWQYVDKSGECWVWTRSFTGGYGTFTVAGGKQVRAHRYSWIMKFGDIPDGLWVLHKCDNPPCVRPDHLFLGDHSANMRDMISKNRHYAGTHELHHTRGERVNTAKLNESQIKEIRHLRSIGVPRKEVADRFGVSIMSVSRITSGVSWRHVP